MTDTAPVPGNPKQDPVPGSVDTPPEEDAAGGIRPTIIDEAVSFAPAAHDAPVTVPVVPAEAWIKSASSKKVVKSRRSVKLVGGTAAVGAWKLSPSQIKSSLFEEVVPLTFGKVLAAVVSRTAKVPNEKGSPT